MKCVRLTLMALALLLPFPALADKTPAVEDALKEWVAAIVAGKADDVVNLYDKNAVMISTFKQHPITTRAALIRYYKEVVSNPDREVNVTEQHARRFGDIAINTGEYTLSYTQEGEVVEIPARFSFTYQLQNGKWMIVDHHSSDVPMPDDDGR